MNLAWSFLFNKKEFCLSLVGLNKLLPLPQATTHDEVPMSCQAPDQTDTCIWNNPSRQTFHINGITFYTSGNYGSEKESCFLRVCSKGVNLGVPNAKALLNYQYL